MEADRKELKNRRILLKRRPKGLVTKDDFISVEESWPPLNDGQVRLKNIYLSLDPAIRGWMNDSDSYVEPIPVGGVIRSGVLGEVVESKSKRFCGGEKVVALGGWEEYSVVDNKMLGRCIDEGNGLPLFSQLSVLGGNGLTAFFGLFKIGKIKPEDTVVISAAAGGVGSIAGQLAKNHGCTVFGIAGTKEKCDYLENELGLDGAINYKVENVTSALKKHCPHGVDVFFDNVGGDILNDVLARIRLGARIILCGAISQINNEVLPPGPSNYIRILTKRATMRGFVTLDFFSEWESVSNKLAEWVREGRLKHREEIVGGLDNAPTAFLKLFSGEKFGKLLVSL